MNAVPNKDSRSHWLFRLPSWLAAAALFVLMVMTFLDVLLRSMLDDPIESATELTRIFMGIIVFSCLPAVSWRGEHIVVDLLDSKFSASLARVRDVLIDLLCGVMLIWPAWRVLELAQRAHAYGDITEYLNIPKFYMAGFIGVSVSITATVLILRALARVFRPQLFDGASPV